MIDFAIVEALEQHYKTADGYVKQLESKRIKLPRDRKAIHYWEGQSNPLLGRAKECFRSDYIPDYTL